MLSLADATTTVIIIMPLKQLIKTANQKLVDAGFQSMIVKAAADIPHQAGYTHLFMRPEVFVDVFVHEVERHNLKDLFSHVVVDESHCVTNW